MEVTCPCIAALRVIAVNVVLKKQPEELLLLLLSRLRAAARHDAAMLARELGSSVMEEFMVIHRVGSPDLEKAHLFGFWCPGRRPD